MKKTKPDNCRHPAGQGNNRPRCCSAFTLVEVNIALLLIAFALFALISLFPVGLRQSDQSHSDTIQAAFADQVLTALRANAAAVTNWNDWKTLADGKLLGVYDATDPSPLMVPAGAGTTQILLCPPSSPKSINTYLVPNGYISYSLNIQATDASLRMYLAWIQITDRQYTDVSKSPVYCTGFSYLGM